MTSRRDFLTGIGATTALVAAGLLLVIGANAHLLYVAMTSEHGCVAYVRPGEGGGPGGALSPADSSCTPQPPGLGAAHPE